MQLTEEELCSIKINLMSFLKSFQYLNQENEENREKNEQDFLYS